jgi:hypothetical protein
MRTIFDETELAEARSFSGDDPYLLDAGDEVRHGLIDIDDELTGDDAYMLRDEELDLADLIEGLMVEVLDAEDADEEPRRAGQRSRQYR